MRDFIKRSAREAVLEFFRPVTRLFGRRPPSDDEPPREMSPEDFEVPPRDAAMMWLEAWGPLIVLGLAVVVLLIGIWWLL